MPRTNPSLSRFELRREARHQGIEGVDVDGSYLEILDHHFAFDSPASGYWQFFEPTVTEH